MEDTEVFAYIDHTLLSQRASWEDVKQLCSDAMLYGTASVCIPPCYVKQAKAYVGNRMNVCTVIGFPNGYHTTATKTFEAQNALVNGADELDMVINIGELKAGHTDYVLEEVRTLKQTCGIKILKVIIEACLLTDEEKIRCCDIVTRAGADYIKTSTGFAAAGATFEDVRLLAAHVGPQVKVKAAGGIATFEDAKKFIALGASRLGTSRIIALAKARQEEAL